VVLGGSRATATHQPDSDWDLGVYYRGSRRALDPDDVRRLGHEGYVSALGEWGPIMHGGAWLTIGGTPVDVIFRDLDAVERWLREARLAAAVLCVAHGRLAGRREWVLNEKGLVRRAGLAPVQALLAAPGATSAELADTVAAVVSALGTEPLGRG
jgi:predicted nucleotidyltransferase